MRRAAVDALPELIGKYHNNRCPMAEPESASSSTRFWPARRRPGQPGDLLIYRFTNVDSDATASYTPNGDGALVGARVPSLRLPQ